MNNEEKILQILEAMQGDVSGLKSDVSGLKSDVSGLKSDVSGLKSDVSSLKAGQATMDGRLSKLEAGQATLENKIAYVMEDLASIKRITINIEQGHGNKLGALFDGYDANTEKLDEHTATLARIEKKVDRLETVTRVHDLQIERLSVK